MIAELGARLGQGGS